MPGDTARPAPDDLIEPPPKPDPEAAQERRQVFRDKPTFTDLRNERFEDQSRHLRREHWFRLVTAVVVFAFVMGWMLVVAGVLVAQGSGRLDLPEKVLIALLVTTTFNVVGLLAAAVRYFFPRRPAIFGQNRTPSGPVPAFAPRLNPHTRNPGRRKPPGQRVVFPADAF